MKNGEYKLNGILFKPNRLSYIFITVDLGHVGWLCKLDPLKI